MIYELLKEKNLDKILASSPNKLFPAYDDRQAWDNLDEDIKRHFKQAADNLKDKQYAILPATFYIEYTRSGNRSIYESVYGERRRDLLALMMAECIYADGEYIDNIIDLVWAICEETSWVPSPHNNKGELPDIEYEIYVDLFAAETGAAISWVYYFLGDIIAQSAPTVKRRMELEVNRRIISPYLQYDHFPYMGFTDLEVNNWNPWINSNIIIALAIFEQNRERLIQGLEKTARSMDMFVKVYKKHGDGACDEGPGYFAVAGASLFDYLETLSAMTGGGISEIYADELIKDMARYIYRVYIGRDYYVNFADGPPRLNPVAKLFARLGEAIGDDNLIGFASEISAYQSNNKNYSLVWCTYRGLKSIFQAEGWQGKKFDPPEVHWFSGTQILTARDIKSGIFIAAKGGHNSESHNHNDVGHFILYSDGQPVIIDAGVESYTKKTFSTERYNIWTMRSNYHNLANINGFEQPAGKQYCASDIRYTHEAGRTELIMQLKDAYPSEAQIRSYERELIFEHSLTVRDSYKLDKCTAPFIFNLLCANKPVINNNIISLGGDIELSFDNINFDAVPEEIELTDEKIRKDWQRDYLYRISLTEKEPKQEGCISIVFKKV